MADYTWKEMMAVLFAREIQDGDRVTAGAHTEIFFAATMLAQKTHAPNLKLQLGGTCFLVNVSDQVVDELPMTSTDYRLLRWAETVHDHPETFLFYCPPGRERYYAEGSPYRRTNHFWFADKFFVGGIQADVQGNVNLVGLGTPGRWTLRGPGSIGINDIVNSVRDVYIFLTQHEPARLVERVDFVSMPGKRRCRELGFMGNGPKWIVTPKAIFDFEAADGRARLCAVFPGVAVEEVRERTGFRLEVAPRVETVPAPSPEELALLRKEIDPTGVLRR